MAPQARRAFSDCASRDAVAILNCSARANKNEALSNGLFLLSKACIWGNGMESRGSERARSRSLGRLEIIHRTERGREFKKGWLGEKRSSQSEDLSLREKKAPAPALALRQGASGDAPADNMATQISSRAKVGSLPQSQKMLSPEGCKPLRQSKPRDKIRSRRRMAAEEPIPEATMAEAER